LVLKSRHTCVRLRAWLSESPESPRLRKPTKTSQTGSVGKRHEPRTHEPRTHDGSGTDTGQWLIVWKCRLFVPEWGQQRRG
jgi:hypothetical protein